MKTITTILILKAFLITNAQSIEKFSIDSGGSSFSGASLDISYILGETNVQELITTSVSVSEGFINSSFEVNIDSKVFLQGPLLNPSSEGLMNDNLRAANLIPTTSPYADNATCDVSVFSVTGSDAIVDWVWLELRSSNDNKKLINGKSALLQRDGDIVSLDGISPLMMSAPPNDYFVVVNHRNHLGAMSSLTLNLSENSSTVVDFRSDAFVTFGNNARVDMGNNLLALWAGDTNATNKVKFSGASNGANVIKDYILNDPSNILNFITFGANGYLNEDVDMNGVAKFSGASNDSNILKDNVLAFPGNILNFITYSIIQTIPN